MTISTKVRVDDRDELNEEQWRRSRIPFLTEFADRHSSVSSFSHFLLSVCARWWKRVEALQAGFALLFLSFARLLFSYPCSSSLSPLVRGSI